MLSSAANELPRREITAWPYNLYIYDVPQDFQRKNRPNLIEAHKRMDWCLTNLQWAAAAFSVLFFRNKMLVLGLIFQFLKNP
jgi:hypothetical protein